MIIGERNGFPGDNHEERPLSIIALQRVFTLEGEQRVLFDRIFNLSVSNVAGLNEVKMTYPIGMDEFLASFKRDGDSLEQTRERMSEQRLVSIQNRWTSETARYNAERSNRPRDFVNGHDFREEIEKAREKCAFCDPENRTPETAGIGRFLDNPDDVVRTCANAVKFGIFHEIALGPHNPFEVTKSTFRSEISKLLAKGRIAFKINPEASKHLVIAENRGPDAAASLMHQHKQLVQDEQPDQGLDLWNKGANNYKRETSRDFNDDWFWAHEMVGLGLHIPDDAGSILVVASLTPKKDMGVTVIGSRSEDPLNLSSRFIDTCWYVEDFMVNHQGVEHFNDYLDLPPLDNNPDWQNFRPMFTFVKRSPHDMGFKEVRGSPVISIDPNSFAADLFTHVEKSLSGSSGQY